MPKNHRKPIEINPEILKELFADGLSQTKVASRLGIDNGYLCKRIKTSEILLQAKKDGIALAKKRPPKHPECCKDHKCDFCSKCRNGQCCRTDDPNYQLPQLGEWIGMVYGDYGRLVCDENGHAQCHCCGETFNHLGLHVWNSHDLTPDEYRAIFGLKQTTGLIGVDLKAVRQQNVKHLEPYRDIGADALRNLTPEQRQHTKDFYGTRLEQKLDPKFLEIRKRAAKAAGRKSKLKALKNAVYYNCAVCNKRFRKRSGQEKYVRHYCSKECYMACPVKRERDFEMYRQYPGGKGKYQDK